MSSTTTRQHAPEAICDEHAFTPKPSTVATFNGPPGALITGCMGDAPECVTDEELAEVERRARVLADMYCQAESDKTGRDPTRTCDYDECGVCAARRLVRFAAELRALRAPVDVDAEVERIAKHLWDVVGRLTTNRPPWAWLSTEERASLCSVLRPRIENEARLARENEGLRRKNADMRVREVHAQKTAKEAAEGCTSWERRCVEITAERDAARAEVERLDKAKAATERIADAWKALAKAWNEEDEADAFIGDRRGAAQRKLAALSALRALGIDPEAP